ncbi:unnamed protein product [Orchesella dallaii]|uniref:Uncharacterized protein n=1 Tax=Orchesella dallaii TaxID=48710 RepID=A0ABP1RGU3_9HEXA
MDLQQEKLVEWFKKHFYSLKTYYDHDDARGTHVASTLMQASAKELLESQLLDESLKPCLIAAKDAVTSMNSAIMVLPKKPIPSDEYKIMKCLPITWSVESFSDAGNEDLLEILNTSNQFNSNKLAEQATNKE